MAKTEPLQVNAEAAHLEHQLLSADQTGAANLMRAEFTKLGPDNFTQVVASLKGLDGRNHNHLGLATMIDSQGQLSDLSFHGHNIYQANETRPLTDSAAASEALRLAPELITSKGAATTELLRAEAVQFGQANFNKIVTALQRDVDNCYDVDFGVTRDKANNVNKVTLGHRTVYANNA
jgi:hypothetical protein